MATFRSLDPQSLPDRFDACSVEVKLAERWAHDGVYTYDPARPREETFVVDTPPPTVSGSLHIGHVFSFTQPDLIVRYQRMRGRNIYYPMGWDDNGLPTERRVQNYFHVRVDVAAPYEAELAIEQATPEQTNQPPRSVSRPNFIELCHRVTREDERAFQQLFTRLGLSVDWGETYATIDDRSRTLAQLSFADLYAKGELYLAETPTMWDVDFQTAIAQAEVEDRQHAGAMHDIAFAIEGGGELTIATTRPELLPACVGIAAHPDDTRYQHLFGKRAITPLFAAPVPIFATELAARDKGTGILMVCTFGDQTDVVWWREQKLPLRQILSRNGRLAPIVFGEGIFESLDPERANASYGKLAGKTVRQARAAIVELLRESGALRGDPVPLTRAVKFFEKGDQPLELIPTRQWFVKLLDKKSALVAQGARVTWHPPFMGARFEDWTNNLQLDWCVSRQRFFGVQIPVWYPLDAAGARDHAHPILAPRAMLPVDPTVDVPPGYTAAQRDQPNGFSGEADVFDTWFTSSLTPQIGSRWLLDPERHARLFPADIRPQSHEIIRTWAFYTIAKALLHDDSVPWHHALISGWVVDPDRKKMAKTRGNAMSPLSLLDEYTVDGVRYWAASARLGVDTKFDAKTFSEGKRLVTKIFNASKYVLAQSGEVHPIRCELDRAFVAELGELITAVTADFERFDYAAALQRIEQLFWKFTDGYLELAKARARGDLGVSAEDRGSAVATLRLALAVFLRLFAPAMPYITDEVWSWCFADERGEPTIHRAAWPSVTELAGIAPPEDRDSFALAIAAVTAVNKEKTQRGASVGRVIEQLALTANAPTVVALERAIIDIRGAVRATAIDVRVDAGLADRELRIASITVAPRV